MTSLKETVIKYLAHQGDWIEKGHMTDNVKWRYFEKGIDKTYMAETVGRKLREAESESRIAVKDNGRGSVMYKFLPPEKRSTYIPFSKRLDATVLFKV